jgi:ankyrin repeat protein
MTWIRTDCYTPTNIRRETEQESLSLEVHVTSTNSEGEQESSIGNNSSSISYRRCPLHKHIRNKAWLAVTSHIREHPSHIGRQNRVGWSSLILAIYHNAPLEVIAEMLALLSPDEQNRLLSTPVPNGARLSLHFAARFSHELELFKLLVEPYPLALAVPSTDGSRPLDRAIYYSKDAKILQYLEQETKQQVLLINNEKLRHFIMDCCQECWSKQQQQQQQQQQRGTAGSKEDKNLQFILNLYGYSKEREMINLFRNVLSYVGIPRGRQDTNYPYCY